MSSEKPAEGELLNCLLNREVFSWNDPSAKKRTIEELIMATEKQAVDDTLDEILSNTAISGKTVFERVLPRIESWQATRLLDHLWLWLTAHQKLFWKKPTRAKKKPPTILKAGLPRPSLTKPKD